MNYIVKKKPRCQCKKITIFCKHYKYYINYYAIIIQKNYKGYKCRKALNNIYIKLPCDLQYNIIKHIRYEFYTSKLNKKLEIIIENKINKYLKEFEDKFKIDANLPFTLLRYLANNQTYIQHIYKLFDKYNCIIANKKQLHNYLSNNKIKIFNLLNIYEKKICNAYSNDIYELSCVLYNRINNIHNYK